MIFSKKAFVVWLIAVVALVCMASYSYSGRLFAIIKNLEIFTSLYKEIHKSYIEDLHHDMLMKEGIDAMLEALDPYTQYISADEIERYRKANTGQYGGIGVLTRTIDGATFITMVYEEYSAHQAGLKIGDEIIKIEDFELKNISIEDAEVLMHGAVGSPVRLTIERLTSNGKRNMTFEMVREKIKIKNVPYYGLVNANTGYIRLKGFTPDANKEVRKAVGALRNKNIKSLILDLRGNPGGLLIEAIAVCNIFLPKNLEIVSTKGKTSQNNFTYKTQVEPVALNLPLAIIINQKSASASEIVAGTLQDYDRAVIVGEQSFGKGLVQVSRPLPYNAQMKITTSKYYIPTGRCIQALNYQQGDVTTTSNTATKQAYKTVHGRTVYDGGGIDPDIAVKMSSTMGSTIQTLRNRNVFFDYATWFASQHDSIAPPHKYQFNDESYMSFKTWAKSKNLDYVLPMEEQLNKLLKYVEEDYGSVDNLDSLVEELRAYIQQTDNTEAFIQEMRRRIKKEIVSRYYLEKGAIESSFREDKNIIKATAIINDSKTYQKILGLSN